jgi:phosphatidylglycerol---prolipoprotein diacylglyceryl transferase
VIPYLEEPSVRVFGQLVTAFQVMVFAAVIAGYEMVVRRSARLGWDRELVMSLLLWTLFLGFAGSHIFDTLLYEREALRRNPLVLLELWGTMSSYGGLLGGIAGALWAMRRRRLSPRQMFAFMDIVAFAFPFAWIFGRLGCALAHDHIGIETQSFLAVRFPSGPRYDLGLLELIDTVFICALFLWLDRRQRPTGFYVALFFALYAPVRFALDALRIGDTRYAGWTPGQYLSLLAAAGGFWLLHFVSRPARAAET